MAFNPLQNFLQGQQAGQGQQANRLAGSLAGQMGQGQDISKSDEFQKLMGLDQEKGTKILGAFTNLSKERKQAFFDDMVVGQAMLSSGDSEGARDFFEDRSDAIKGLAGDSFSTDSYINLIDSGNPEGALDSLNQGIAAATKMGYLKGGAANQSVQSSKILEDGTVIQVMKGGGRQVISPSGEPLRGNAAKMAVRDSNRKVQDRKIELKNLEKTIKSDLAKESILNDQQKAMQRSNISRLGVLSSTSSGRGSAIKKATKFKLALESGEASSGAGRKAATFIPGVFTSQGQFDEEFNAFSEVAARQQLKASGEIRPTDADVQGMKQAMFGLGRDEKVNVQLLSDFIIDQNAQNDELDQLIGASKSGDLSKFTFTPIGSDDDLMKKYGVN